MKCNVYLKPILLFHSFMEQLYKDTFKNLNSCPNKHVNLNTYEEFNDWFGFEDIFSASIISNIRNGTLSNEEIDELDANIQECIINSSACVEISKLNNQLPINQEKAKQYADQMTKEVGNEFDVWQSIKSRYLYFKLGEYYIYVMPFYLEYILHSF